MNAEYKAGIVEWIGQALPLLHGDQCTKDKSHWSPECNEYILMNKHMLDRQVC